MNKNARLLDLEQLLTRTRYQRFLCESPIDRNTSRSTFLKWADTYYKIGEYYEILPIVFVSLYGSRKVFQYLAHNSFFPKESPACRNAPYTLLTILAAFRLCGINDRERMERLRFLLDSKHVDINEQNSYGCTSLFYVTKPSVFKLLVDYGINTALCNRNRITAMESILGRGAICWKKLLPLCPHKVLQYYLNERRHSVVVKILDSSHITPQEKQRAALDLAVLMVVDHTGFHDDWFASKFPGSVPTDVPVHDSTALLKWCYGYYEAHFKDKLDIFLYNILTMDRAREYTWFFRKMFDREIERNHIRYSSLPRFVPHYVSHFSASEKLRYAHAMADNFDRMDKTLALWLLNMTAEEIPKSLLPRAVCLSTPNHANLLHIMCGEWDCFRHDNFWNTFSLVLEAGIDVNRVDTSYVYGRTPLYYALTRMEDDEQRKRVCRQLLEYGADPDIECSDSDYPNRLQETMLRQIFNEEIDAVRPLKCLVAKKIHACPAELLEKLPKRLRDFVELHKPLWKKHQAYDPRLNILNLFFG